MRVASRKAKRLPFPQKNSDGPSCLPPGWTRKIQGNPRRLPQTTDRSLNVSRSSLKPSARHFLLRGLLDEDLNLQIASDQFRLSAWTPPAIRGKITNMISSW